jgi:ankyrin repeat protein
MVQLLLEAGADVNIPRRDDGTALQVAAGGGHYELVQILLAEGADVNAQGNVAEEKLSTNRFIEKSHFKDYENALQAACANWHHQIVELLLDSGADINARNDDCGTALEAA